ncbi:MAG: GerAB/ArcD/ProY family transporter [Oscillospiraceae bacterium]|nr:GerAB/ArcD/ProY family transporter [Oscillospiraceae bacterium]
MRETDRASARQAVAVAFVGLLSPMIRRFPKALAVLAGRSAWLSVWIAVPLLPLAVLLMRRAAMAMEAKPSRAFAACYGLWLLAYCGFLLRGGAERLVTTVYPCTHSALFLLCMAALCAVAAAAGFRSIARTAMLLRPLLIAVPVALFLLALGDTDPALLLPVTSRDLLPNLRGAASIVNLCGACFFLLYSGVTELTRLRFRDWAGWGTALVVLLGLMAVACLGLFGPELTAALSYPFFLLARDAPVLGSLERMEPLVVALWVFADVVFLSALLRCAVKLLGRAFAPGREPGTIAALLCAAAAAGAGLLFPVEQEAFAMFSERAIPFAAAVMNFALPLLFAAPQILRRK